MTTEPAIVKLDFSRIMGPLALAVCCNYMTIGIALGVLPAYIHNNLGYSSVVVGIIVGLQSFATVVTRNIAGNLTDNKGSKLSLLYGTVATIISGIFYLLPYFFTKQAVVSLCFIILGRLFSGLSESFQITGALSWGIGLAGTQHSGRVMAWNGIAMYGGLAAGAPIGMFLSSNFGLQAAFSCIILLAILGWMAIIKLPILTVQLRPEVKVSFFKVISLIGKCGTGLAFSAFAFGCIASFITLLFQQQHWPHAALAFLLFGIGYIAVRLFFASLPDKLGGYKIAFLSLIIEIAGQLLLWRASSPSIALAGATLSGIGFSLVFPAFGVEAVRNIRPEIRGAALGAYVAFFDFSLGITGPVAGLIANKFSYQILYLFGAIGCFIAAIIAITSRRK